MTLPSFTAGQSVYRNTPNDRSSSPVMRISGITNSQYGNGFLPDGSYLRSCDECTCNDDDLSYYRYDPTRHDKPAKMYVRRDGCGRYAPRWTRSCRSLSRGSRSAS